MRTVIVSNLLKVAQAGLNLVMSMNPIGLIISLIAGLVVAFITAYKHSETFRNIVNSIWETMKTVWQAVWDFLVNFFTVTLPALWGQATAFFTNLWATIMSGITSFVQSMVDKFNQAWAFIRGYLQPFIDYFIQSFENLKLFVLGILSMFISLFTGDMEGFKLGVLAIVTALKRQFENVVNNLMNGVLNIFRSLWNGAKSLFNSGKNALANIWNSIKVGAVQMAFDVAMGISNGFQNAKTWAIQKITGLYNSAVQWFSKTVSKASSTATDLVSKFRNIDLYSIGKDIIRGLINGLSNMFGSLKRKATEIANSIKDKIAGALKVKSPSRVMMDIGKWTGVGLVNGMDKMKRKVSDTAGRLARVISTPMNAMMGAEATATVKNISTFRHVLDLVNVPSDIDGAQLKSALLQLFKDPRVQTQIDRVNYKNMKRNINPQGG